MNQSNNPIENELNWLNFEGFVDGVNTTTFLSSKPRNISEQIRIHFDDNTGPLIKRLYVYNPRSSVWSYIIFDA